MRPVNPTGDQRLLLIAAGVVLVASVCGCDAPIASFPSNEVLAKRLELGDEVPLEQATTDAAVLLEEMFGTPDNPAWPDFLNTKDGESIVSIENLQRAAGAVSSDEEGRHRGLYREHCVVCHGVAGDGLGPAAALLNPYPRDFRHGKFKFTSTPIGIRPTYADLKRTLREGIVGTSMPAFDLLADEDIEALVDYVIYLSVRGELERRMLTFAATDLDPEDGERLYVATWKTDSPEKYEAAQEEFRGIATAIAAAWRQADQEVLQVRSPPEDLPVAKLARSGDHVEGLAASIDRGRELFRGKVAACSFCHGNDARGDGQQNNYDDWTRDWTLGFDPRNLDELEPMLELGALEPRNIQPRNLQRGIFRGGSSPDDLYTRIVNGIEGTPMPAAPLQPENPQGLTNRDVWDLVNYLLSLEPEQGSATVSKVEQPDDGVGTHG